MTLAAYNVYQPLTLAPSEVYEVVLEDLVTTLPVFGATLVLRSMDPSLSIAVSLKSQLIVTGAPMAFNGTWENTIVDTTVAPEQSLTVQLPVYSMDGVNYRHKLTLTNPSASANFYIHVLVNGMIDTIRTQPASTYLVIP